MKKIILAALLMLSAEFLFSADDKQPIDFIVVMDTSSSMHRYYKDVSEYAIGPLIRSFLRFDDTFHLISFSGSPKLEITRKINGQEDITTIIARMLLLYPLDPYSDIISALAYSSGYLNDLPENRQKTLVFISDGEHAPQPGSIHHGLTEDETDRKAAEIAQRLKGNGWSFFFIKIPDALEKSAAGVGKSAPAGTSKQLESSSQDQRDSKAETTGNQAIIRPGTSAQSPSAERTRQDQRTTETAATQILQKSDSPEIPSSKNAPVPPIADAAPHSGAENGTTKAADAIDKPGSILNSVTEVLGAPVIEWDGTETKSQGEALATALGSISVVFPEDLGQIPRRTTIKITVKNPSPNPVLMETIAIMVNGVDRMERRAFKKLPPRSQDTIKLNIELPKDMTDGATEFEIRPIFAGSIRTAPEAAVIKADIVSSSLLDGFVNLVPVLLIALAVAGAAFIAFLIIVLAGRLHASPKRAMATAAGTSDNIRKERKEAEPTRAPVIAVVGLAAVPEARPTSIPAVGRAIGTAPSAAIAATAVGHAAGVGPAGGLAVGPAATAANAASRQSAAESQKSIVSQRMLSETTSANVQKKLLPTRAVAAATVAPTAYEPLKVPYIVKKTDARIMLSLHVDDQNTAIGRRNIHLLKAGHVLTLGGGRSDFLVFLVRMPHRIADIRFDGERCILIPRRPDLFIDTGMDTVEDCIGKPIRVVSEKGYILNFRIERYQNPLDSLNKFLHSIEIPG